MKRNFLILGFIVLLTTFSCIGDDYVNNLVDPRLKITNALQSISVDTTIRLEARFTNNVGDEEEVNFQWFSSNTNIAEINIDGLLQPLTKGETNISVEVSYRSAILRDSFSLIVNEETVEEVVKDTRSTSLKASSFYTLKGDCELKRVDDQLILSCENNYVADSSLPGLYVYLSNNPASISNAYSIGAVSVFNGAHEYVIEEDIDLFEYSHVLYFCKPFNVKVGDGKLSE